MFSTRINPQMLKSMRLSILVFPGLGTLCSSGSSLWTATSSVSVVDGEERWNLVVTKLLFIDACQSHSSKPFVKDIKV